MKLYHFEPSSASYRVRIAISLKSFACELVSIDLLAKEQFSEHFSSLNPMSRVPLLVDGENQVSQSGAIIDYLESKRPEPRLWPGGLHHRILAREIVDIIACDIHPLGNISVLRYLKKECLLEQQSIDQWRRHWIENGLAAIEHLLGERPKREFVFGDRPSVAECYIVPQLRNARWAKVDINKFPNLLRVEAAASSWLKLADI